MEKLARDDIRFVNWLVICISLIVATVMPIGYYVTSVQHVVAIVKAESHFKAGEVTKFVNNNPQ